MNWRSWPEPMSLEENLADMEMHAKEFVERKGFTYSILDEDMVIGCVYIEPAEDEHVAHVRSWVTESRAEMDQVVWESLRQWLTAEWPFDDFIYESRT